MPADSVLFVGPALVESPGAAGASTVLHVNAPKMPPVVRPGGAGASVSLSLALKNGVRGLHRDVDPGFGL